MTSGIMFIGSELLSLSFDLDNLGDPFGSSICFLASIFIADYCALIDPEADPAANLEANPAVSPVANPENKLQPNHTPQHPPFTHTRLYLQSLARKATIRETEGSGSSVIYNEIKFSGPLSLSLPTRLKIQNRMNSKALLSNKEGAL